MLNMDIDAEIERLALRIPEEISSYDAKILRGIFEDALEIALAKSHRREANAPLLVIVRNYVLSVWNKRGDEGMTGSGAGGQSFSYEDAEEKLSKEIVRAGLRVPSL